MENFDCGIDADDGIGIIRTVLLCQGSNNDLETTNRCETWTHVTVAFDARLMRNVINGRLYEYRGRIVYTEIGMFKVRQCRPDKR